MNNYISREKLINIILMMVIVAMLFVIAILLMQNENLELQAVNEEEQVEAPKIVFGKYTLIHYPNSGWTNAIYITEYYKIGQDLYYKEKGSTVFKPIWFPNILPVDGWIEEEQLADYGYWISEMDFD
ncbi:MAG: hypothetical protein K0R80_134 [Clostridia bacterium]|jgi:hypothetical protein|nr:hypothetical protein [Clostridia bacterium]